jgi:hypothetical protein
MTTMQQMSNVTINNKQYEIRYETMTCNKKAISKVIGWGMIFKIIRDKNVI